ncbi:hypothetical protein QBC45DRAFT_411311 [Copromyces sp. CBS 386.78]|nr:hypothetical protein QBC45DRAFT_411311 [Copromyces sp. CBS 386.78]
MFAQAAAGGYLGVVVVGLFSTPSSFISVLRPSIFFGQEGVLSIESFQCFQIVVRALFLSVYLYILTENAQKRGLSSQCRKPRVSVKIPKIYVEIWLYF